jgi:glycosyltransferase involved in cell wall biosynthesis
MARALSIPIHEFVHAGPRHRRHLRAVVRTLRLLIHARPAVVFASNPSLVLTCLLLGGQPFFRFRLALDAHYGGVIAVTGGRWLQRILDFLNRRADIVIVTNANHADRVRRIGGRPFVCPDPLPEVPRDAGLPAGITVPDKSVLFVCSYEVDEPYDAVFEAARSLTGKGFTVYVSGNYRRVGLNPNDFPQVSLLGFVDRTVYHAYLRNVAVVLDLTTWEDCLVCGAYEAMAAETPCVLSETRALTSLFTHGAVFTSHDPRSIADAVTEAYERREALRAEIVRWTPLHEAAIRQCAATLRCAVGLDPAR